MQRRKALKSCDGIIRYFERAFGADASFVPLAPGSVYTVRTPDVFAIPPAGNRLHWVLFTVGASLFSLDEDELPAEEPEYLELIMSLAGDWTVGHTWPPHVLRYTASSIVLSCGPIDGLLIFDGLSEPRPPDSVFCLFIGPSRQLEPAARVRGLAGEDAEIRALYPVTVERFLRSHGATINGAELPEEIVRWRDFLRGSRASS